MFFSFFASPSSSFFSFTISTSSFSSFLALSMERSNSWTGRSIKQQKNNISPDFAKVQFAVTHIFCLLRDAVSNQLILEGGQDRRDRGRKSGWMRGRKEIDTGLFGLFVSVLGLLVKLGFGRNQFSLNQTFPEILATCLIKPLKSSLKPLKISSSQPK